jgi:hypothetical protein
MTSFSEDSQRSEQDFPEYRSETSPLELTCSVHQTTRVGRGDWSASRHGRFTPRDRTPGTFWLWGWVGPRAGLDAVDERKTFSLAGNGTPIPRSSSL